SALIGRRAYLYIHQKASIRSRAPSVQFFRRGCRSLRLTLPAEKLLEASAAALKFRDALGQAVRRVRREFLVEFPVQLPGRGYKIFLLTPW
ncbi:MAG: hypothetical protein ACE5H0_11370, partial [Bacteroidota bacterium]